MIIMIIIIIIILCEQFYSVKFIVINVQNTKDVGSIPTLNAIVHTVITPTTINYIGADSASEK